MRRFWRTFSTRTASFKSSTPVREFCSSETNLRVNRLSDLPVRFLAVPKSIWPSELVAASIRASTRLRLGEPDTPPPPPLTRAAFRGVVGGVDIMRWPPLGRLLGALPDIAADRWGSARLGAAASDEERRVVGIGMQRLQQDAQRRRRAVYANAIGRID